MQTETNAATSNDGGHITESKGFTCEECGRTYAQSILAHIISAGQAQEYYACPRCMTKAPTTVGTLQEQQSPTPIPSMKRTTVEKETVAGCLNHFGYLRKRERDKPIPEECLTCSRMVDCLRQ
jgi:DNA-directed RNA polymerase subunit RPC12/RpoP